MNKEISKQSKVDQQRIFEDTLLTSKDIAYVNDKLMRQKNNQ